MGAVILNKLGQKPSTFPKARGVPTTTAALTWGARDTGAGVRGYDVALRVDNGLRGSRC
jgi:hypothetical protein